MVPFPPRTVSPNKITGYLLDLRHEVGGPKAVFFRRYGFTPDRVEAMAAALVDHPERNAVEDVASDTWGTRYIVRCSLATPDGRDPCIRTVWMVRSGETQARLVTAYPA